MKFDIRAEMIFFIGVLFLTLGLFLYTFILQRLLKLIRKPGFLAYFPLIGALALLVASGVHGVKILYIYPRLAIAGLNLYDLLLSSFKFNLIENLLFLSSGFFTFLSAGLYALWVSR